MTHLLRRGLASSIAIAVLGTRRAPCQEGSHRYPVPPKPLGDEHEIALAMSAAPDEVSSHADVYVLRGDHFVKAKSGTNHCACMVSRDLHEGSRYPICFDAEGAKTTLWREIKETSLRATGMPETEVQHAVEAAFKSGELHRVTKPALSYMMSPRQVLFSSAQPGGFFVGSWSPHIMIAGTGLQPQQIGLLAKHSKVSVLSLDAENAELPELIIKVPAWSNGQPVR